MTPKIITQEQYSSLFTSNKKILDAALKQATAIRRFEIELYWKRATYFWSLIAASFVGYAAYFGKGQDTHEPILLLIACLGLVFSVAWHCINKGSKYWQENWENHVELLEDELYGPLYKTFARRPNQSDNKAEAFKAFFVAPKAFSVSKINQLVSTYVAVVWALLLINSIGPVSWGSSIDWVKAVPVTLSVVTCLSFWLAGMSHNGGHDPVVSVRETKVRSE